MSQGAWAQLHMLSVKYCEELQNEEKLDAYKCQAMPREPHFPKEKTLADLNLFYFCFRLSDEQE